MIVKSKLTAEIPTEPIHTTLLARCLDFHREDPVRKAFFSSIDKADAITFKQFYDYSLNLGAWFVENGFRKGDVVLLCLKNSWQFIVACVGAWSAGLVVSPASTLFTEYELRFQLEDSTAKIIITEESLLAKAVKANSTKAKIICISKLKATSVEDFLDIVTKQRPFNGTSVSLDMNEWNYGIPKRKYRELLKAQQMLGLPPYKISFLPFYHAMGLFGTFFSLYTGSSQITMQKFNMEEVLQHIQEYQITTISVVPSVILAMAESPLLDSYDLSSLIIMYSGAAPLSQNVADRLRQRLPHVNILQGYGMTEMSLSSHIATPPCPQGSVGQLMPNTEMKVVSRDGSLCGPHEQGELWIRGPQVMKGYWRRPDLSKDMYDNEGFMRTGDVVYYDKDGFTFICDRDKELIKVNGKQVSPSEIEEVLMAHPEVLDCCIIGVPDEKCGEVPLAFVVAKSINENEIHAYVRERLASYKRLKGIKFVDSIPRTPTGKTLRRVLKDDYLKSLKPKERSHL
ncbi:AMP-binding enzyme [Oesophagostomum dentatum]|uniref:AMP-binding enzyme n=1 Tax=Oesophagostomum dentatum TaxID=61180 RepID=A0A0B1TJX4_OESDE|nr:AMP-binding enzyme [Oesophagostomum dentatum]